jgi:hypothetical protein
MKTLVMVTVASLGLACACGAHQTDVDAAKPVQSDAPHAAIHGSWRREGSVVAFAKFEGSAGMGTYSVTPRLGDDDWRSKGEGKWTYAPSSTAVLVYRGGGNHNRCLNYRIEQGALFLSDEYPITESGNGRYFCEGGPTANQKYDAVSP